MIKKNSVFIATSLDGYIADKNGNIDWLHTLPNPENDDMGYVDFLKNIDALVMGRKTFETVCSFDIDWPYEKPVFVLSSTLKEIPESHAGKAILVKGILSDILKKIQANGFNRLYIDGGTTIRNFLKEDLIDEMFITTIPILLGGGISLFDELPNPIEFELVSTKKYIDQVSQNHYLRKK